MTIDKLLETRNASNISLSDINIKIIGIKFSNKYFRYDCECVCDCACDSETIYYNDNCNCNEDCVCYCS